MMRFSLCLIASFACEVLALWWLYEEYNAIAILFHLVTCLLMLLALQSLNKRFQHYAKGILLLPFLFTMFVPGLGFLGSVIIMRWLYVSQKNYKTQYVHTVKLSEQLKPMRSKYDPVGIRLRLQSSNMNLHNRIEALRSISSMPPSTINNLIRTVLPDKQEELRLLAFNIIDRQEKKIITEINQSLELLNTMETREDKAKVYKWLALQYWNLIYSNLVEPNLIGFILKQTVHYLKLANEQIRHDPTLWFILGRIYIRQRKLALGIEALERAVRYGANRNRIAPYLAEAYFYQGNYHETRRVLTPLKSASGLLISKAIVDFWSQHDDFLS